MSDKSFVRFGGLSGILLAVTAWAAVAVYFLIVPPAQQQPIADLGGFVASLTQNPTGTLLYTGLYALTAFWSISATIGVYYVVRKSGEAWAFFATIVGAINAVGWLLTGLAQLANLRYIASLSGAEAVDVARMLLMTPLSINPFNLMTSGLTSIWFLVTALLILRTSGMPKLLGYLGLVAFADLAVGFIASLAGVVVVPTLTAIIAGAVGGPIFWLWFGVLIRRSADGMGEAGTR